MQIIAECPGCKQPCRLVANAADRRTRCPKCGRMFKVPHLNELSKAVKIIKDAEGTIYVDQEGKTYG